MESTLISETTTLVKPQIATKKRVKPTFQTVEAFEKWQSTRKSDYNYEFYYGEIIKKQPMKQNELEIYQILLEIFMGTEAFKTKGLLYAEVDSPIDDFRKRVPDISYYTKEQVREARKSGTRALPSFAIEILSDSESLQHIENKIQDYFDAGVLTVWYINPKTKKIYVYTSPTDVKIYFGDMMVNAQPALPDFEFPVNQLFDFE